MNVGRMYGRGDVRANMTRHAGMGLSYPTDRLMPGDTTMWGDMVGEAVYGNTGILPNYEVAGTPEYAADRQRELLIFGGIGAAVLVLFLALRR